MNAASPERLQRLRSLCLGLPGATEKVTWGDPTWRVKDKIFAMQKGNYAGGRPSLWLKGERGAQEVLVGADPSLFFVPPYVGHKGWIGIYLDGPRARFDVIADLVRDSYRLIAPLRLQAGLAASHASASARADEPMARAGKPASARRGAAPKRTKLGRTGKLGKAGKAGKAAKAAKLGATGKKRPAKRRASR